MRASWLLSCLWAFALCAGACATPDPDHAGDRCLSDRTCGDLLCHSDLITTPADLTQLTLTCAEPTGSQPAGQPCERAGDCDTGLCLLAGACAHSCGVDADCSDARHCQAAYARTSEQTLGRVSVCVDRVSLPSDARIDRRELSAAVSGKPSLPDRVQLQPWAAQTLYVVEHLDDVTWPIPPPNSRCRPPLCVSQLLTADAEPRVVFDVTQLSTLADGPDNPVAQGVYINPVTIWAPNGPRLEASERAYTLQMESKVAGALAVTALARSERGSRLDLNLYDVGASALSVSRGFGLTQLMAALDELDRILQQADIYLGEIRRIDVPGSLPDVGSALPGAEVSAGFATLVSQYQVLPELPELFRLSAGAGNSALDVFLVSDIDSRGAADIGGISGGTPVAFGMHGTAGSGVVIAADMFLHADDPVQLGRSLAHELGHALGLFHTTEADGLVMDPLPDTPVCGRDQDQDHNGTLTATECAAHGGDNLMFPTSDAGDVLTPQQRAVLQRALILQ